MSGIAVGMPGKSRAHHPGRIESPSFKLNRPTSLSQMRPNNKPGYRWRAPAARVRLPSVRSGGRSPSNNPRFATFLSSVPVNSLRYR